MPKVGQSQKNIMQWEPPTTWIGIDPGVGGGIAAICGDAVVVHKMPETDRDLIDVLKELTDGGKVFAIIEQQTPRPTALFDKATQAWRSAILKSTCILYGNYRMLKGAMSALDIPHEEVNPRKWQKILGIVPKKKDEDKVKWKNRLKARAQQLFPKVRVTLAVSDALLLAEFARRNGRA